jgi:hypothetical protein
MGNVPEKLMGGLSNWKSNEAEKIKGGNKIGKDGIQLIFFCFKASK